MEASEQVAKSKKIKLTLKCFTDSDWGARSDKKSISGVVVFLNSNPIYWCSKAQTGVSLCTAQSETVAMSEGARCLEVVKNLLESIFPSMIDTGVEILIDGNPMELSADNMAALKFTASAALTPRMKHIGIREMYVKDLYQRKKVNPQHVDTHKNCAGGMTKPLEGSTFKTFLVLNNICSVNVKDGEIFISDEL